MKKWIGRIAFSVSIFGLLGIIVIGWLAYQSLHKSLPVLDGERTVAGLKQKVRIERDALGIPTIYAYNPIDQARAFGYLHGQERFFQMDLYRRLAAGELAELIAQGIKNDLKVRVHQFRKRAQAIYAALPEDEKILLSAYTEGVNAGLSQLGSRPFEYHLLQADPRFWRPEDSILCAISMAMSLQDTEALTDRVRGQIAAHLPDELFNFFYKNGSRWESPQDGSIRPILPIPDKKAWATVINNWPNNPDTSDWTPKPSQYSASYPRETYTIGSNNWAVRPEHGAAWVANDMHLGLRLPNTWYRATIFEQSTTGEALEVHGASLPGIPAIVVGSNGKVAWGLTNSNADTEDVVYLVPDPENPAHYLTPQGSEPILTEEETIIVAGHKSQTLVVEKSRYGPIIGTNEQGQKIAFQWVSHQDWSVDIKLPRLARTTGTEEALAIAKNIGSPALNIVVGDADGNIGWTIMGALAKRKDNSLHLKPRLSTDPLAQWDGRLTTEEYPDIINPESGIILTANARVVGGEALNTIGDSGYTMGSRQWGIQTHLSRLNEYNFQTMRDTIMDTEAHALYPWQALIRWAYNPARGGLSPKETRLLHHVDAWSGKAEASSIGYRIIRNFRGMMMDRLYARTLGPVLSKDAAIYYNRGHSRLGIPFEEPFLSILESRPDFLIDPYFGSWEKEMRAMLKKILDDATLQEGGLEDYRWGKVNQLAIRHPLSSGIPVFGDWINLPQVEQDGDQIVPNATSPEHGPSQRFIVQVGDSANARFSMPGGQSGHPLSDYYKAGHEDWINGIESPLRPGSKVHTLTFTPEK